MSKYHVTTETKGILEFNELPENTYFGGGWADPAETGKAFLFTYDNGTCLIPIKDSEGNDVFSTNPSHFGKEMNEIKKPNS